jgi:hypothetical protein
VKHPGESSEVRSSGTGRRGTHPHRHIARCKTGPQLWFVLRRWNRTASDLLASGALQVPNPYTQPVIPAGTCWNSPHRR